MKGSFLTKLANSYQNFTTGWFTTKKALKLRLKYTEYYFGRIMVGLCENQPF